MTPDDPHVMKREHLEYELIGEDRPHGQAAQMFPRGDMITCGVHPSSQPLAALADSISIIHESPLGPIQALQVPGRSLSYVVCLSHRMATV